MTEIGFKQGLVNESQYKIFKNKQTRIAEELERVQNTKISASDEVNAILAEVSENIDRGVKVAELLKRPNITYDTIKKIDALAKDLPKDVCEQVEILIKYDGYLKRQEFQVEQASKLGKYKIPENIDYDKIEHISTETRQKLAKIRPKDLAQASRIGGVKPADISVLMVMLK